MMPATWTSSYQSWVRVGMDFAVGYRRSGGWREVVGRPDPRCAVYCAFRVMILEALA